MNRAALENAGFLDWEVNEFEAGGMFRWAFEPPYLTEMVMERQEAIVWAGGEGLTDEDWADAVWDVYRQKRWHIAGELSAWVMLRDYEERYKRRHPEYDPDYPEGRGKRNRPPKTPELFDNLYEGGKPTWEKAVAKRKRADERAEAKEAKRTSRRSAGYRAKTGEEVTLEEYEVGRMRY